MAIIPSFSNVETMQSDIEQMQSIDGMVLNNISQLQANKAEIPITITLDPVENANGAYSHTTENDQITEDMKAIRIEVGTPETFKDVITVTTGEHEVTVSCSNAVGSSTIVVTFIKTRPLDSTDEMSTGINSAEFDMLSNRVGQLSSLKTANKSTIVDAVNSIYDQIDAVDDELWYKLKTSLTSGSLNSITTVGAYHGLLSNVTDGPSGETNAFDLKVFYRAALTRVWQQLYVYDSTKPKVYLRVQNGESSWTDWQSLVTYDQIAVNSINSGTTDLNTLVLQSASTPEAVYSIMRMDYTTNYPTGLNANFPALLKVNKFGSYTHQEMIVYTANGSEKIYRRQQYYEDASNPQKWGDWYSLDDKINYAGATSFTPTFSGGTYTGGVTDVTATYARSGNVVVVSLVFTLSGTPDLTHGYVNITNMPYRSSMIRTGVLRISNNGKFGTCSMAVGKTFQLYFLLGDGTFPQSGQICVASITYITSDP